VTGERRAVVVILLLLFAYAVYSGIGSDSILLFAAVVPSIILHELSHGVVANSFGDDTAKRAGRLTLNPIAHIDLFGTLLLPAMLALSGLGAFGYAKPVPVNPAKMRKPRNQWLLTSLAGPATNIALALLSTVIIRATTSPDDLDLTFWVAFGYVNILLAVFNLLPIPPLDGSAMVERLLPRTWWPSYLKFRRYSMGILLLVVLGFPGALSSVTDPFLTAWENFAFG
jgi:Zn-dependent protease